MILNEVITDIAAGPFGSNLKVECFVPEGFPIIDGANLKGFKVTDNVTKFVTEDKARSLHRSIAKRGDVVSTISGTIGQIAYIPDDSKYEEYLVSQRQFRITFNTEKVNVPFLVYYFHSRVGQSKILAFANQVGVPALAQPLKNFRNIDVDFPPIDVQNKIASILSSLDDKIAVNKKICENLEAQAQALFKHWFVDFAPFKDGKFVKSELGLIPEGWRVGVIGDYCVIRSGFAFKSSWWQDEGVKVVKIKNITDGGTLDMSDCSCVSEEHASLASSFQTKSGDLLIAMTGATIGKFCVVNGQETYCVNQRVGKFFLGDNPLEKLPFIYCILKRDDVYKEIVNKGQGSAQPNISGKDIEEIKIIIPPQSIIKQFNEELYSSFELRINGELENHRLSTLRDTLLPKLMSGQIKL